MFNVNGHQCRNMSSQKTGLNFNAHGRNCSDPRCVLPLCVNWKLSIGHASPPKKDKQTRHTNEDTTGQGVCRSRSGECKEALFQNQTVLAHDAVHEQLLEELKEFERVFQSKKDQFESSFLEALGIHQPNVYPLRGQDDWKNIGLQQVPHIIDYEPLLDKQMNAASRFPVNAEQTCMTGYTFDVPPDKSVSDSTEDPLCLSHLDQFIAMDSYVVGLAKEERNTAKRTRQDHKDFASQLPTGSNTIKETVSSLEENNCKEKNRGLKCKSKDTNKLFGILSEILRMFESPMSAEREAFYVQVLQKALREIQNAVLL